MFDAKRGAPFAKRKKSITKKPKTNNKGKAKKRKGPKI
jgi:hypothetical protein